MVTRSYDGPPIDARYQWISERPELDDRDDDEDYDELDREAEDVVYVTPPEPAGEEIVENVPIPIPRDDQPEPLDRDGQTRLAEFVKDAEGRR